MASTTDDALGADNTPSDDTSAALVEEQSVPAANAGAEENADVEEHSDAEARPAAGADLLEREGEAAADYLEGLLDIIDVDGDIDMDVEGDRAVVSIIGDHLRQLVGPRGSVLDALQELTRLAVAQETGERSRLMLDIGGHRARRRAELTALGTRAAEQAATSGASVTLEAMTAFERKVVHDAVAAAGQLSESEGVEPERRVVVLPTRGGGDFEAGQPKEPVADQA